LSEKSLKFGILIIKFGRNYQNISKKRDKIPSLDRPYDDLT